MIKLGFCCLIIGMVTVFPLRVASVGRYNISFAQLDECQTYFITATSYAYNDFFKVNKLNNNNVTDNTRLHLKFYVIANMDAHILLTVIDRPRPNDAVYEVVIGAGGNTFSAIRTMIGSHRVSTNQDHHLLSHYEPTPIEIVQTKDGDLSVYIPGFKEEPLLRYHDDAALQINFISFSSFGTNSARWFYDCPFDSSGTNSIDQEERAKTKAEELLDLLIINGQNSSLPVNLSSIQFHFQMRSLAFDQPSALLTTRMQLLMHWRDERLIWKPEEFGNLTSFEHPDLQIWAPQLAVLNGALDSLGGVLKGYELRIYANGNITLLANNLEITSWCVDTARNWPNERVICDLELGVIEVEDRSTISLIYDRQQRPLSPNEHVNTPSAWTFVEIAVVHVANDSSRRYSPKYMLQSMNGDVAIQFTMQRNSSFYKLVFAVPLIGCQIFIVLSFLIRSNRRGALLLIVFLITAWGLMLLTRHASTHYVPPLMTAYQDIMLITIYCYLLHIAIIWLVFYPPRANAPSWLLSILNSTPLRFILGLRFMDSTDYCDVLEKPWRHLAKLLNNFSFILVSVMLIVINVMGKI
ncbi:neuronal acetylcholine receptor subunit beta-3 [Drosophila tropicalis]|uniref:neuronal acetylcholine receptor subunit beta-3 n=1 Tax=Drosophila tropicalis TaxID=46794 RepID=UPI0035ABAAB3